jgi:hypothetical protein
MCHQFHDCVVNFTKVALILQIRSQPHKYVTNFTKVAAILQKWQGFYQSRTILLEIRDQLFLNPAPFFCTSVTDFTNLAPTLEIRDQFHKSRINFTNPVSILREWDPFCKAGPDLRV